MANIQTAKATLKIKEHRENAVGSVLVCTIVGLTDEMGSIDTEELRSSLTGLTWEGHKVVSVELFDVLRQSIGMPIAMRLEEKK